MGNSKSQLTESELEDYKELTYLTEREIQYAFNKFKNLNARVLNKDKFARISTSLIKRMPEFQNNPFADRICETFCSENDGRWSFEDFLDMVSVFSEYTPAEEKAMYAFNIYDFDEDGFLSKDDLRILVNRLTGGPDKIEPRQLDEVLLKVMEEADLDKDGMLSPAEFKHILLKCPDFAKLVVEFEWYADFEVIDQDWCNLRKFPIGVDFVRTVTRCTRNRYCVGVLQ